MTNPASLFQCKHCMKTFKRESTFMNHKCKEMIRLETIQTINGQQAYQFYKRWLLKCRKSTQTIEAFLNSTYFNAMLRFVDFCKSHNILDPIAYIDKMVELKISPSLWDRQEAYKFYLEKLDKQVDPYILAEKTLSIILELSNALEINACDLFDRLPLGEIVELIEKRHLSPWILLSSYSFKQWILSLDNQEALLVMNAIKPEYWKVLFDQNQKVVLDMQMLAKEVGI